MTQAPGQYRPMLRSARFFHVFVSGLYLSTVLRNQSQYPPKPKHFHKRTVSATGNEGPPKNQIESKSRKNHDYRFFSRNKKVRNRVIAWLLCSVTCVKTDLSPETRDERLHMDEYTEKEIKRSNESSNHDDDLTYVTSSPETSNESSENEHTTVQTSVIGSNQVREIST